MKKEMQRLPLKNMSSRPNNLRNGQRKKRMQKMDHQSRTSKRELVLTVKKLISQRIFQIGLKIWVVIWKKKNPNQLSKIEADQSPLCQLVHSAQRRSSQQRMARDKELQLERPHVKTRNANVQQRKTLKHALVLLRPKQLVNKVQECLIKNSMLE